MAECWVVIMEVGGSKVTALQQPGLVFDFIFCFCFCCAPTLKWVWICNLKRPHGYCFIFTSTALTKKCETAAATATTTPPQVSLLSCVLISHSLWTVLCRHGKKRRAEPLLPGVPVCESGRLWDWGLPSHPETIYETAVIGYYLLSNAAAEDYWGVLFLATSSSSLRLLKLLLLLELAAIIIDYIKRQLLPKVAINCARIIIPTGAA